MIVLFLLALVVVGTSAYNEPCVMPVVVNNGACGTFGSTTGESSTTGFVCTEPTTQFCRCVCQFGPTPWSGYTGWHGGHLCQTSRLHGHFEAVCGLFSHDAYAGYQSDECSQHCQYDIRTNLCSSNGLPDPDLAVAKGRTFQNGADAGFNLAFEDIQAATLQCICDPGYYGYSAPVVTCQSDCYLVQVSTPVPTQCFGSIEQDFCSGQGTDISGSGNPRNRGGCPATPQYFAPSPLFSAIWPSCSNTYRAMDPLSSLLCLCQGGFVGGQRGQRGQCSQTVSQLICSGHGKDSANCQSGCPRYPANVPTIGLGSPTCTCDPFFGVVSSGNPQCSVFLPCAQTLPCGGKGIGSCSPSGLSCICNSTAFGGLTQPAPCCPLQFGSTNTVCGGFNSACQPNSQCLCPPGRQAPGCCLGCDAGSQTCLLDGRCSCPVIGSKICGDYGTCISSFMNNCTCALGRTTLSDGTNAAVPLGGQFCCPLLAGIGPGPCGGGTCSSVPRALDPANPLTTITGSCSICPAAPQPASPLGSYSRTGPFCCPIIASKQINPCGQFGVCQPDGTCKCANSRITGFACEINLNCDYDSGGNLLSSTECSSAGVCLPRTAGSFGLGDYLAELQFNDVAGVTYRTNDSVVIQDEGAVAFQREVYRAFLGFDPATKRNESLYYTQGLAACQAANTRGLCLWNMLVACQPQRDAFVASFSTSAAYLANALGVIDPNGVVLFAQGPFEVALAAGLASGNSCTGQAQSREAMAALMLWDLWTFLYRDPGTPSAPLGSFAGFSLNPSFTNNPWQCSCTLHAPGGIIGSDTAIGGTRCQFTTCPLGLDNLPCSGFSQGVFRGYCTNSGFCECSPKFQGHACNISLIPGCFPVGSIDALPCSNHGSCNAASCSCSAQFTGRYCDLSRCQPPGIAPQVGECNNRGVCSATTLTCICSTPGYDTQQQTSVPLLLATGNACEQNGQSACGIFVQNPLSAPGIGNWQICSNHGQCLWNYTANSAACACSGNTFGPQCQNSACLPLCNANQHCDLASGGCNCLRFWATPLSCLTPNRTCECSANLCGNGVPSADGSSCICNPGWKKASIGPTAGTCSIVQCPLTVYNDQGVRPCNPALGDTLCTDTLSITESLSKGCCVDTCPLCTLNTTSGIRTCDCSSLSGFGACYTQQSGICFPNCHGSDALLPSNPPNCDSTSAPGTLQCHCDFVSLGPSQFRDLRCQRYTCANGGVPASGRICNPQTSTCCNCAKTAYTGSFCSISACGDLGTPNGTVCACTHPFFRSGASPLCDANLCTPGTPVKSPTTGIYTCNCPANTFTVSIW